MKNMFTSAACVVLFWAGVQDVNDEKRVAGHFWTDGTQREFHQQWSYDVTFSLPIALDPAAKTVPGN